MIHDRPNCFGCRKPVEYDPVFAPVVCDHGDCPSAVFHGVCLMEHREKMQDLRARIRAQWEAAVERHNNGECSCPPE